MLQTRQEVLEDIKGNLENYEGDSQTFDDFFQEVYNDAERNIYTYEAQKDTEAFHNDENMDGYETMLDGVWGAIGLVRQYEETEFGEMNTKIEPCAIANMIDYIRASSVLYDLLEDNDLEMDDELTMDNCRKIYKSIDEELE